MIKLNSYCVRTFSNLNVVLYSCWSAKQFKPSQFCILKESTSPFKKFVCRTYSSKDVKLSGGIVKSKYGKHDIKRLLTLAKSEKWKLTGAVCLLLVSSAVTMAVPFCIGKIIDTIYMTDVEKKKTDLKYMCSFFIIAFAVGALANFGRVYLIQTSGQRIIKRLREQTFSAILRQEINFFDKNKTGELINRLSSDSVIVGNSITQNLSDGLRSVVTVSACISMMVYTSPQLAFVGLCIVPPVALIAISYGRFVRIITKQVQDELASATQITEERISNIRTVRAFTQESNENKSYEKKLFDVLVLQYKEALARAIFYGMTGLSGNLVVLTVLYYGGTMMTDSQITVGDLSAFLMYAGYMGISLGGLTAFYSELMRGIGASAKIWFIMDKIPSIPLSGGFKPESAGQGLIEFRDVHFSYPMRPEAKVFQGLNLLVPAGSVTAVVGGSGSGKSTLAALLLRYYDPQEGGIFLDGMNISTLDPKWVRTGIGLVSQEPILFSCSIRENVLYGATHPVTEKDIIEACREANAFDFIQTFPDKFETMVGQQGLMLSGGQRQRIAIARAILKNPTILILDEATSALDAESEHSVQAALDWLMRGRTVITIAHRLSTIIRADNIAVFKNGNVAEMGSYAKLMSIQNGVFRKLIEKQTLLNDDT